MALNPPFSRQAGIHHANAIILLRHQIPRSGLAGLVNADPPIIVSPVVPIST